MRDHHISIRLDNCIEKVKHKNNNIKDVVIVVVREFAELDVNILDINSTFFNDICFTYSKNGKDIPLQDRIRLYYQNTSICGEDCISLAYDLKNFEVECSCEITTETKTSSDNDISSMFLNSALSNNAFGFITDSNLEVFKCIKEAFNIV